MSDCLGSWIDGVAGDLLPADDRGLSYGDGLFETILIRHGTPRFLEAHLARLSDGLTRLGIHFAAHQELRADIARAVTLAPPLAVLKIIVTRGSSTRRGYAPGAAGPARRLVTLWPAASTQALRAGVELEFARTRIGANPALAGIKHLNRLENVLAAAELADSRAFDALMCDGHGHVICGSACNLFVVEAGAVATPTLDESGIAGILRSMVLRECATLGIGVAARRLSRAALAAADEVENGVALESYSELNGEDWTSPPGSGSAVAHHSVDAPS